MSEGKGMGLGSIPLWVWLALFVSGFVALDVAVICIAGQNTPESVFVP